MSMKKISELQLETTANYQSLSKLNVRFWNQDLNTAELRFLITRDNFPLSLSSENVKIIIVLEQGNNFISSEDFEINSEVDGVASFLIPSDFMSAASGEVTGQVYVGTLDSDEVIVQRKFTFQVENDLLSSIPSELKLQYIKTFSDLADSISTRLFQIEEDMAAMEDYVAEVNQATTDGLNALNNLVNDKTVEYNDNHADKLALINTTVDGYVEDFLDQRSYIDTKYAEFQTAVSGSGLVKDVDAESWQKYKLTKDDGTRKFLAKGSFTDVTQLAPGLYETPTTVNASAQGFPDDIDNEYTVLIDVTKGTLGRTQIKVVQSSNFKTFFKLIDLNGTDRGWKEISYVNPDNPYETVLDAQNKANVAENNAKVYAKDLVDSKRGVLFEGSANGVGTNIKLTGDYTEYKMLFISGSFGAGDFTQAYSTSLSGKIIIQKTNVSDASGAGGGHHELIMEKINSTELKITNDVFYDYGSNKGSGADANRFTITNIEGWK